MMFTDLLKYSLGDGVEAFSTQRDTVLPYPVIQGHQVHEAKVVVIDRPDLTREDLKGYDAFVTNPKVEVLAVGKGDFMRYDGVVKFIQSDALQAKVREIMPQIMAMYDKNGWEMGLFYLDSGHAEIRGLLDLKEEFDV